MMSSSLLQFDRQQATDHLAKFEELSDAQNFLDETYGIHGQLGRILDDGKYVNHSLSPNCLTDMATGNTYALRDIELGEELFEDYNRFEHPPFLFGLLQEYACAPDYYELPPGPTRIEENSQDLLAIVSAGKDGNESCTSSEERKVSEHLQEAKLHTGVSPVSVAEQLM